MVLKVLAVNARTAVEASQSAAEANQYTQAWSAAEINAYLQSLKAKYNAQILVPKPSALLPAA